MGDDSTLVTTRRSLHGVAELVLAGPQHAETGEISLQPVPGGFGTTHSPDVRVVGTDAVGPAGSVGIHGHTPATLGRPRRRGGDVALPRLQGRLGRRTRRPARRRR